MTRRGNGCIWSKGSVVIYVGMDLHRHSYFCDQVLSFEENHYASDIPGQSMPRLSDWIAGSLNDKTPNGHE